MWQLLLGRRNRSIVSHAEQGCASPDPVVGVDLAGQVEHEDEVGRVTRGRKLTLPGARLVERALEVLARRQLEVRFLLHRLEPDDWEVHEGDFRIRILHTLLGVVPLGALHEQAMDVDAGVG